MDERKRKRGGAGLPPDAAEFRRQNGAQPVRLGHRQQRFLRRAARRRIALDPYVAQVKGLVAK